MNKRREYTIVYWIYDYDKEGWDWYETKDWLPNKKAIEEVREQLWGGVIWYESRCSEKRLKHFLKFGFPKIHHS